jgi:hypothetical protein
MATRTAHEEPDGGPRSVRVTGAIPEVNGQRIGPSLTTEEVWRALEQPFGATPPPLTHVVIADQAERAGGWATPVPYDTIVLDAASRMVVNFEACEGFDLPYHTARFTGSKAGIRNANSVTGTEVTFSDGSAIGYMLINARYSMTIQPFVFAVIAVWGIVAVLRAKRLSAGQRMAGIGGIILIAALLIAWVAFIWPAYWD